MSQKLELEEKDNLVGEVSYPFRVDKSLEKNGYAADAAEVGRKLSILEKRLNELNPITAETLKYDNSTSGFEANTVQSALDEMTGKVEKVDEDLEKALNEIDTKMDEYIKDEDKPSGSYIGDGSSSQRVITIGGTGNVLMIYHKSYVLNSFLFVTPVGVFGHSSSNNAILISGATFVDRRLTINTSGEYINGKDIEYHYQVL